MLDELRMIISKYVCECANMSEWKDIRTTYFWYTYTSFLQLVMRPYSDDIDFVDMAVKKNIIELSVAQRVKKISQYEKFIGDIRKLNMEKIDITVLYQQYISQDFALDVNNTITYGKEKNSRDTLGAYYTEEKFAYLITEKTINDYIYSKMKIENFSVTCERKEEVYEIFKTLKFVDSSCGSGAFLVSVIQYCEKTFGLSKELEGALKENLYGYDVDPLAILITKIRIMDLLGGDMAPDSICLGNPLILANKSSSPLVKYNLAAEGRFYNRAMGIEECNIKCDVILGNPPWEKIRFEERKFLSHYIYDKSLIETKENRKGYVEKRITEKNFVFYNSLKSDYLNFKSSIKVDTNYSLSSRGELNTYALFTEWAIRNAKKDGLVSLIVKASLLKASVYSEFFQFLLENNYLCEAYMFTNKKKIFQIDSREEFAVICLNLKGEDQSFKVSVNIDNYNKYLHYPKLELTLDDLERINPITKMLPAVKSFEEMQFLKDTYQYNKVFGDVYSECMYGRLVHLTNHSSFIKKKQTKGYIPVYEGKYIEQYNGKYATYKGITDKNRYSSKSKAKRIEDVNSIEYPEVRYYVEQNFWEDLAKKYNQEYSVVWRSLTSTTNRRTMIATILPKMPTCQSIQLLQISDRKKMLQILALFNSVVFDYLVRLKMSGLDLTQTIVRQIAVPDYAVYDNEVVFGDVRASIGVHIYSRIKYLLKNDNRVDGLFNAIELYDIQDNIQRKKVISEIDILVAMAYGIDRIKLKQIVDSFHKYYTKKETETWF